MKQLLILSYHFYPLTESAAHRATGFAKYFAGYGFRPTIITHHWEKDADGNYLFHDAHQLPIEEHFEFYSVIRLPRVAEELPNKFSRLQLFLSGYPDFPGGLYGGYKVYANFLEKHLKEKKYDFAIGIFSPHHHLKLLYELNKKFGLKYALDFRDLWNVYLIGDVYKPSFAIRIQFRIIKRLWKRWLSKAMFYTTVTEPITDFLQKLTETPGYTITNGFDENMFKDTPVEPFHHFTISHIGTFDEWFQDPDLFFQALYLLKETDLEILKDVRIYFIGVRKHMKRILEEKLDKYSLHEYIEIKDIIQRHEALRYTKNSNLLLLIGWKNIKGNISGKIYEYLASGNNIVVVPGDLDVMDKLVGYTTAGNSFYDAESFARFLKEKFLEWKKNGKCTYKGNSNIINEYSHRSQTAKLAGIIDRYV
jgi:hypothetical protein